MAKAGFWLRGSKGKLAGASLGKGPDGSTIMREIVTPRNPKTKGQLYQRAIMATVMAAYSAGKEIFDHSFQGFSVGSANQRKFMKENAKALRAQLALEVSNQAVLEEALAKVTAPGNQVPVPNQWVVSQGTYDQKLFTWNEGIGFELPSTPEDEKISDYYNRVGMVVGDIYTFVFILTNKDNTLFKALGVESVSYDELKAANFGYVRMIVKQPANPDAITQSLKLRDVFDFQAGGIGNTQFLTTDDAIFPDAISVSDLVATTDYVAGSGYAFGCIRSRLDEDLRSNTTMHVVNPAEFGIVYSSLLAAWKQGIEKIGDSSLILEGGDE